MLFPWLKRRRRRKLIAEPFPEVWKRVLEQNVWHYAYLLHDQRRKLRNSLRIFIAEKEWVGCGGLEMSDEIKVTVAAQACLLLLGVRGDYCFDRVKTIIVYPGAFFQPAELQNQYGVIDEDRAASGEAWRSGPVVLSWDHVLDGGRYTGDGRNLVLHEFAHQIDALDGEMGGVPPLSGSRFQKCWNRVVEQEFHRLEDAVRYGLPTSLDDYGATNRAEFFAVATECFFELPDLLRQHHSELYNVLREFYCLDPIEWTR